MTATTIDDQYDSLCDYIRYMADLMGLRDWRIKVSRDAPSNDDHAASIIVIYGQRSARIRIQQDWAEWDPDELRYTIAHELVHCHLNPMRSVLDTMEDAIGQTMHGIAHNTMTDYIEHATDAIGRAWSESLPMMIREGEAEGEAEGAAIRPIAADHRSVLVNE